MNTKKSMDRVDYCCYSEFIEDVLYSVDHVNFEECESVSIIAKYDEAVTIVEYLLCNDIVLHAITMLEPEYFGGYNKEFIITVDEDGLCVEPMWRDAYGARPAGYLYDESTVCYVFGNCHRQVLDNIDTRVAIEVNIGFDEDECDDCNEHEDCFKCNGDCDNCDMNDDVDNHIEYTKFVKKETKPRTQKIEMDKDMKGFSISTSDDYGYSSFSFHSTDEDLVKAMLKKYEKF